MSTGCYECSSRPASFVSNAEQRAVKASLNRPEVLWECGDEGKAALGCVVEDKVAQKRSNVIAATLATQRSSFHQRVTGLLLTRASRTSSSDDELSRVIQKNRDYDEDLSGEPDKMIIKNSPVHQKAPNIIEDDIATDLEEVNSS